MTAVNTVKPTLHTDVVTKHTSAIHVIGDLGLLERKLVNVLLLNAFDKLAIEGHTHTLPVVALLEGLDWKASKNIETIKDALSRIQSVVIVFDALKTDKKGKWESMPSLSYASIEDGILKYRYDKELSNKLAKPDSFAIINVNIQNLFDSSYALALYENCYRFVRTGSTGWIPVATLRGLLNATNDMYKEFKYLNQRVLNDAIKAVNDVSNITIEMEVERVKRKVERIRFKIVEKSQRLLADQPGPTDADLREQPLFADLIEWIGAPLALQWMRDDRERAEKVVARVNIMEKRGEIRRTKGGLARRLYEGGGSITDVSSESDKSSDPVKVPDAISAEEREKDKRAGAKNAAAADLTDDEQMALAREFKAVTPGATFNAKTKLIGGIHAPAFRKYMNERRDAVIASRDEA